MKYFLYKCINQKLAMYGENIIATKVTIDNADNFKQNFTLLYECDENGQKIGEIVLESAPSPQTEDPIGEYHVGEEATTSTTIEDEDPEPSGSHNGKEWRAWKSRQKQS
jgi:hypothetical protein